jgi:hypothetical protein
MKVYFFIVCAIADTARNIGREKRQGPAVVIIVVDIEEQFNQLALGLIEMKKLAAKLMGLRWREPNSDLRKLGNQTVIVAHDM